MLPIKGFPSYLIREDGMVFTKNRGLLRQLNVFPNSAGYLRARLCNEGNYTRFLVHRLVGEYFVSNPYNKPEINHKDRNILNNHYTNLEWITHQENMNHAMLTGNIGAKPKPVYQMSKHGVIINQFPSIQEAGQALGINYKNISEVCRGNRKTAGGFVWEFTGV